MKENVNYEEIIDSEKVDRAECLKGLFCKSDGKTVVLSVHSCLDGISENDDTPPMHELSGWSRFVLYIIKDGKNVIANIPAEDVSYILDQTRKADWLASMNAQVAEDVPLCYTKTLMSRDYKGKTPAEVLLENPQDEKGLIEQYEFLKKNCEKYPNNKTTMLAIEQAVKLSREGKLKPYKSPVTDIYTEDVKYLQSKKDSQGRCLVYGVSIKHTAGTQSPVSIEIKNCYANLKKDSTGKLLPELKSAVNQESFTMFVPYRQWFSLIDKMNSQVENFKTLNFKKNYDKTQQLIEKRNRAHTRTA